MTTINTLDLSRIVGLEMTGCIDIASPESDQTETRSNASIVGADFYSIYARMDDGTAELVEDFETTYAMAEGAQAYQERIHRETGKLVPITLTHNFGGV